jgi:hypothetical protein
VAEHLGVLAGWQGFNVALVARDRARLPGLVADPAGQRATAEAFTANVTGRLAWRPR